MTQSTGPPSKLVERVGPSAVDDVRAIRLRIDEQFEHNIPRLAEYARRIAEEFRERQRRIDN